MVWWIGYWVVGFFVIVRWSGIRWFVKFGWNDYGSGVVVVWCWFVGVDVFGVVVWWLFLFVVIVVGGWMLFEGDGWIGWWWFIVGWYCF